LQTEFAVLVDRNSEVLAAPLCPELQGNPWDPAFIVSTVLETGMDN